MLLLWNWFITNEEEVLEACSFTSAMRRQDPEVRDASNLGIGLKTWQVKAYGFEWWGKYLSNQKICFPRLGADSKVRQGILQSA